MAGDSSSKISVDVGASARAEIKAEIPTNSMGRLVDALTDIIRPFSEGRGLKGDLIRLQREEVALEIAEKAAEKLNRESVSPTPIPSKFLLPFTEASSLEGDDRNLKEIWSSLLANTAISADANSYYALSIVKEMTPTEAEFLLSVYAEVGIKPHMSYEGYIERTGQSFDEMFSYISEKYEEITSQEIFIDFMNQFSHDEREISIILRSLHIIRKGSEDNLSLESKIFRDMDLFVDVLQARRICQIDEFHNPFRSVPFISGHHLKFTHLGFNFMRKILWQPSVKS